MSTASCAFRLSLIAMLGAACKGGEREATDDRPDASSAAAPDASMRRVADWSCVGDPAPASPEQIAITGTMFGSSDAPIADALVELVALSDDAVVGSVVTAADGTFQLDVEPGPDGLSAYLRAAPEGRVPLYNYFDGPLREDAEVPMLSLAPGELAAFYGFALGTPLDETRATVSIVFKDCAMTPAADVAISLDPEAEQIAYFSEATNNVDDALTTTDESGFAFAVNAPAGDGGLPVVVHGQAGDTLLEGAIETHPGSLVSILVRP